MNYNTRLSRVLEMRILFGNNLKQKNPFLKKKAPLIQSEIYLCMSSNPPAILSILSQYFIPVSADLKKKDKHKNPDMTINYLINDFCILID